MKPIFLLGYMGSGKTTIGKIIAESLNIQFFDLDNLIEKKIQQTIPEIFTNFGEKQFREIERNLLNEVISFKDCIISTGGGTPCFFDNIEKMNEKGITIFLDVSIDELTHRLYYKGNKRPLLQGKTKEQLHNFIVKTLAEREQFYLQAKIRISADDTNATTNRILQLIKNEYFLQ